MALMTRKGMDTLLKRIMESGGLTADMEKDIERLRGDFDEREGILKKYGEEYNGEADEYEFTENVSRETSDGEWENKYKELKQRYIDRFFGGIEEGNEDGKEEGEEIKEEQEEDIEKDGKELSYDKLFEEREV